MEHPSRTLCMHTMLSAGKMADRMYGCSREGALDLGSGTQTEPNLTINCAGTVGNGPAGCAPGIEVIMDRSCTK